ncbi:MAG: hypothetical protein WC839_00480 [Candidatus Paceibacterota bacterium]
MIQAQIDKNFTACTTLGSPQAWKVYIPEHNESLGYTAKAECYSFDEPSITGFVEFSPLMNPHTGCEYNIDNPFTKTTGFQKDNLYNDITRYNSTNAISQFTQTFSNSNLQGDQLAVASSALDLEERGKTFKIIADVKEIPLITFCQARGWNCDIIQNNTSTSSHKQNFNEQGLFKT